MAVCEAAFDVTGWDPSPYPGAAEGPLMGRVTVRKAFRGDLEGESEAELLTCRADPDDLAGGAGYVASERVEGTLGGRSGTFVMQHWGLSGGGRAPVARGHIVPGSGTGELAGLSGTVEIAISDDGAHTLHLEYELEG